MARTAAQVAGLALLSSEDSLRAAVCEAIRCEADRCIKHVFIIF